MPIRIVPIKSKKRPGRATTGDRAKKNMMKARGGKMAKGYAKGGAKMMKAMGGRMMTKGMRKGGVQKAMGGKMMKSKGYAKGGMKMRPGMKKGGMKMTLAQIRSAAKGKGYKLVKS